MSAQSHLDTNVQEVGQVGRQKADEDERSSESEDASADTPLSHTFLDSYRRDLLTSYPSIMGQIPLESIDEYIQIQRREELVLRVSPDTEHPAISVVFPMSMQDPCVFHCFLVGAQSLYEYRRNPVRPKRSSLMISLQGNAISALQKRLSKTSAHLDDGLLFSVLHLMVADACQRDLAALKSHLNGVRQIITLRGGLGRSPAHQAVRGLLTMVEFYIALGQYLDHIPDDLKAIPGSLLEYARHPFSPKICHYISKLPHGFAEVALSGHLSVQCIKLLFSVASWHSLISESSPGLPGESVGQQERFCRLFCEPRECARNAVLLLLCLKRAGVPMGVEYVICIGLAICVRHLSGENRTNVFDSALLEVFSKNFKAMSSPTLAESEMIIWFSLVINWRTQCVRPLKLADDVLDYALRLFPASHKWEKVAKICGKFWWFEKFNNDWERCWRKGMDRIRRHPIITR